MKPLVQAPHRESTKAEGIQREQTNLHWHQGVTQMSLTSCHQQLLQDAGSVRSFTNSDSEKCLQGSISFQDVWSPKQHGLVTSKSVMAKLKFPSFFSFLIGSDI